MTPKFRDGAASLHVWKAPRCCRCCWSTDHTLNGKVLLKLVVSQGYILNMWWKQYQTPNLPELHGIVIIHYSVLTLHKENWNSFTEIEHEGGRGALNRVIMNDWLCFEMEPVKTMWSLSTWSKLALKLSSFFTFTKEESIKAISK